MNKKTRWLTIWKPDTNMSGFLMVQTSNFWMVVVYLKWSITPCIYQCCSVHIKPTWDLKSRNQRWQLQRMQFYAIKSVTFMLMVIINECTYMLVVFSLVPPSCKNVSKPRSVAQNSQKWKQESTHHFNSNFLMFLVTFLFIMINNSSSVSLR
jgi:hypothetical protein